MFTDFGVCSAVPVVQRFGEGFRTSVASDADDHAANLTGWSQLYDQLAPGKFRGSISELWIGNVQLFRESTSLAVRQSCRAWPHSWWFGIPLDDGGACKLGGNRIDKDVIAVRSAEFELLTPDNFEILGIVVDQEEIAEYLEMVEHAFLPRSLNNEAFFKITEQRRNAIGGLFQRILEEAAQSPQVLAHEASRRAIRASIFQGLASLCGLQSRSSRPTSTRLSRHALVARIRDYVLSGKDQPITVPEICSNFYVSRRTLQNAFHDVVGMSPAAYLRMLRLNGVRRMLRDNASRVASVQDAAAEWGFWHMSQFACDYKRMFGELPSESLRRSSDPAILH